MITSRAQAYRIQDCRFLAGKKGVSKAVRRFMLREFRATKDPRFAPWTNYGRQLPASFEGCGPHVPNKGARL